MLTEGQRRLYSGDYNYINQEWQGDGSVIVTVQGGKSGRTHRLHVVALNEEAEEVLIEIEEESGPPEWMKKRLKAAKRKR